MQFLLPLDFFIFFQHNENKFSYYFLFFHRQRSSIFASLWLLSLLYMKFKPSCCYHASASCDFLFHTVLWAHRNSVLYKLQSKHLRAYVKLPTKCIGCWNESKTLLCVDVMELIENFGFFLRTIIMRLYQELPAFPIFFISGFKRSELWPILVNTIMIISPNAQIITFHDALEKIQRNGSHAFILILGNWLHHVCTRSSDVSNHLDTDYYLCSVVHF